MPTTVQLHSRIKQFVEELAASTDSACSSESVLNYLHFAAAFHRYSLHNSLLIWMQKPSSTHVAGFNTWKKLGRYVKKGEKGIAILAPIVVKARKDDRGEEDPLDQIITRFRTVYIFDVSQTEGAELPEVPLLNGGDCPFELIHALTDFANGQNIHVETKELSCGLYGTSSGGKVAISDQLNGSDYCAVLVHEVAHELLNHKARRLELDKKTREIEAETVAHVICKHFHIETKAANYLVLHGANGKEVMSRLESIVSTIQSILTGIESRLNNLHQNVPSVVNQ